MTTKEYLSQVRRYDAIISNKLEELTELRIMAYGPRGYNFGERVQTSKSNDRAFADLIKIADLEREVDKLVDKRVDIIQQIESLENTDLYDVIAKRYILNKDIKTISMETNKSIRQVFNLIDEATDYFEKKYGKLYLLH